MQIIPALYLVDGKCVSSYKGERDSTTILSVDPVHAAKEFEKQGATSILIIDGNAEGSSQNHALGELVAKNTELEVIFADGIYSMKQIDALLQKGITKVALGDAAKNGENGKKVVAEAIAKFGADKIWFLIRAERSKVQAKLPIDVADYGKEIADQGVQNIIFWDTKSEGTFHPNFDEIEKLKLLTDARIFAFGGIGSMTDIEILKNTGAAGVVLSRALFEKRLYLRNCIEQFS